MSIYRQLFIFLKNSLTLVLHVINCLVTNVLLLVTNIGFIVVQLWELLTSAPSLFMSVVSVVRLVTSYWLQLGQKKKGVKVFCQHVSKMCYVFSTLSHFCCKPFVLNILMTNIQFPLNLLYFPESLPSSDRAHERSRYSTAVLPSWSLS